MKAFDKKLGKNFLDSVPSVPGVYRVYDDQLRFIYVGKAKNLKRRLAQYRNTNRRKKHRRMRKIIENAAQIQYEVCESELEAKLLEANLIQSHRPKWNIVGAFFFMYPMVGMRVIGDHLYFCYTTEPESFEGFNFHGAFRSREITGEAFFSLMKLLRFVGHPIHRTKSSVERVPKHSYVYGFRQLPVEWEAQFGNFWKGLDQAALENLVLALVENAGARKNTGEVQDHLNQLARFWKHEAVPLFQARQGVNHLDYPVSQKERDLIFLKFRHRSECIESSSEARP
jgi:excinuclease ABC subunit C